MRKLTIAFCFAAFLFACNDDKKAEDTKVASSTDTKPEESKPWIPIDSATAMQKWAEYSTPGEPHKMMAKSDGEWTGDITQWFYEGAQPMTMTGTSTNKMIMGGRYQLSTYKGEFMGQPFDGMSIMAYDNAKKVYQSTWIDNMGTGVMNMEGPWNEATKSITLKGKMINPGNGMECNMREVFTLVDDNTQKMEMFGPDPKTGKEYKNMEIIFKRKK